VTRWLALATLAAWLLRAGVALLDPAPLVEDAAEYHGLAARLAEGRGYVRADLSPTAFRPPGLVLLLAGLYRLFGPEPAAAAVALALVGAAVVPLAALLARRTAGEGAARVAAALALVYPPFVTSWYSPRALLAEVPLTTFVLLALWLGVLARSRVDGRGVLAAAASGLAAGAGALTRGTALALAPLLALWLALGSGRRSARAARAGTLLLGAALVVVPWLARNRLALGAWIPISTNGGISVWASYNPASRGLGNAGEGYAAAVAEDEELRQAGLDEVARSRHFLARARAEVERRPGRAAALVLRKALLFADPSAKDWSRPDPKLSYNWAYGAALPLAAGGWWVARRRPETRLLAAFALLLSVLHVVLHTDVRYRAAVEPVLLVFAAGGAVAVTGRLGRSRAVAAGVAYAFLHALVAWRYDAVFAALSSLTRALGLG
jgi:4-amino-4-deoxy-L-arabinose transferase-like glycosyltransferase